MLDFSPELKILRKLPLGQLSPEAQTYLWDEYLRRQQSIDPNTNRLRADVVDPRTGWVDNDLPRDEGVTTEIMELTQGYALSGPLGLPVVREFKTFREADRARVGARVTFNYEVQEDAEPHEDDPAPAIAGEARRPRARQPIVRPRGRPKTIRKPVG